MTTAATLACPSFRTDRDGVQIRRVVVPPVKVAGGLERIAVQESWAALSLPAALAFTAGVLTYNLAPFVGWRHGLVDAAGLVTAVVFTFIIARAVAPSVARGFRATRALDRSLSWWLGMTTPDRDAWLPPLPNLPLSGRIAVIPWHGAVTRDGVIVRRTRLARHVDWVLLYDRHEVVAVARVVAQVADHPGVIARHYGPRMGLSARAYRAYTAGHARTYAIILDLAYRPPYPVTLPMVGITGPLGSHRYLGGKS